MDAKLSKTINDIKQKKQKERKLLFLILIILLVVLSIMIISISFLFFGSISTQLIFFPLLFFAIILFIMLIASCLHQLLTKSISIITEANISPEEKDTLSFNSYIYFPLDKISGYRLIESQVEMWGPSIRLNYVDFSKYIYLQFVTKSGVTLFWGQFPRNSLPELEIFFREKKVPKLKK